MISLFQYIGGVLIGGVALLSLFFIERHPTGLTALVLGLVCSMVLMFVYLWVHRAHKRRYELLLYSMILGISMFGLISVMDQAFLRVFLMILLAVSLGLIYGWGIVGMSGTFVSAKPVRRFFMMILTFGLFSLATVYFAVGTLGVAPPGVWVLIFNTLVLSLFFGVVVALIWRLYEPALWRTLLPWVGCVSLVVFELALVIRFLPLGYVVSGFVLSWIIYIVQLLIRFHLTDKDIIWQDQRIFLTANAALFVILLLLYARWV